jgi:hypothetical protein
MATTLNPLRGPKEVKYPLDDNLHKKPINLMQPKPQLIDLTPSKKQVVVKKEASVPSSSAGTSSRGSKSRSKQI